MKQRIGLGVLVGSGLAFAHTGAGSTGGFGLGFIHPLGGLDHLLAMVAVGLWAVQIGGRAIWAVPLAFMAAMGLGGTLGIAGIPLPFVETGILASVVFLGALILMAARFPWWVGAVLVGLFALFHGHAHGSEMAVGSSGLEYAWGFVMATALLHGLGIALGLGAQRFGSERALRWSGGAILLAGIFLSLGF